MSDFETAARPYARALYELALEQDQLGLWSDVLQLAGVVASDDSMRALMDSPSMLPSELSEIFLSVMSSTDGAPKLDQHATNMINLLSENDRLVLLPAIQQAFEVLKHEAEGAIEVQVVSARKLSAKQEKDMAASLKKRLGKDVTITSSIDKSLIAGAIIHAGDLVIDGSARGRLDKMTTLLSR